MHLEGIKGTVSRDFPAQTAYIAHLQITSLFMDSAECKLGAVRDSAE